MKVKLLRKIRKRFIVKKQSGLFGFTVLDRLNEEYSEHRSLGSAVKSMVEAVLPKYSVIELYRRKFNRQANTEKRKSYHEKLQFKNLHDK